MKILKGNNKTFVTALFFLLTSSIFLVVLPDKNVEGSSRIALSKNENKIWIASNQWSTKSLQINNVCDGLNIIKIKYKNESTLLLEDNTNCSLEISKDLKGIRSIEVEGIQESKVSFVLINREKKIVNEKRWVGLLPLISIILFSMPRIRFKYRANLIENLYFVPIAIWAAIGPTQYDENWIALTAENFNGFGWFSNIYSANEGPIPQGFLFNLLTLFGLNVSYSPFTIRILWAATATIGLVLFLKILDFCKIKSKVRVVVTSHYLLCLFFLAGGWRPEILIIVLWNYLIIQVIKQKISTKSKLLISLVVGISVTTGQAGLGAITFLFILFFRKLLSLKDLIFMTLIALLTILTVTFAQAGPELILEGINGFRASSTHSSNRIIGEFTRYASIYFSTDTLGTLLAVTFIIFGSIVAIVKLNRNSFLVLLPSAILVLSASKWIWHIAPLITPVVVFLLTLDRSREANSSKKKLLKKFSLTILMYLIWISLFGFQESGYFPNFANIMTIILPTLLISALIFRYFHAENNINQFINNNSILILVSYLAIFSSFILSSYSWKMPLVGPLVTRIHGENCSQLEKYTLLNDKGLLALGEFNSRPESFSESIVNNVSKSTFSLKVQNRIFTPEKSRYVIYLKFPKGGAISMIDQQNNFITVRDLQFSTKSSNKSVLAQQLNLNEFRTIKNVYIPPSNAFQELHFEDFKKIPSEIKILFNSTGSYSNSNLYVASLVSGEKQIIAKKNMIVSPQIAPILGCNSTIKVYQMLPAAPDYIFYTPGLWFKESDKNFLNGINDANIYLNKSVFLKGTNRSPFSLGKKL